MVLKAAALSLILAAPAFALGKESAAADALPLKLEDCLRSKVCQRQLIEDVYPMQFSKVLVEVEAAQPGRFFKGAAASALYKLDDQGHFIHLDCPGAPNPCSQDDRRELETRVINVTLLRSLPLEPGLLDKCFDPSTWRLLPEGEKTLARAAKAWPKLKGRVAQRVMKFFETRR